ncbi:MULTISPECIES: BatD family protein [unclassified Pseudomonas]|uniref:BatD family protein n=1 Tax=unclassified Pseudomonas TaxID=196821 RepID=UPI0012971EE1|nr:MULTISPECIES: BatD family protein [unclassified Pseudomonas]MQT42617.1 protein BatD [Pseudomonas sp. FSL R10-0765]MQT50704.1 protein BatD [Pseudomonas sp. FSL R10-2398]MQU00573.1 protein BatD [Pseudomonas sp. FSL R10-2245]MQU10400.1 protein BatD [Pseudomonas sp. FSL R10-2189]MQU35731.1 protein BatD [Pseudomonas sp. FSL R10-2172]
MNRFCVLLFLLCCWTVPAHALGLVASVDRDQLNSGETVELTLETNDATLFGKPDLAPLDTLFEVRGTRQVNQLTTLNDDNKATTRWIITLQPKQTGTVTIPSLQVGDYHSLPINLTVTQSSASDSELAPVFIEASLDQPNVYVQAQAILTLRVYHSVALYDDSNLTPLHLQDAIVEQLGESRTYEKLINGVRHGVIEVRYGIYPQHSGELQIPALTFSATQVDNQPGNTSTPSAPKPGKMVHVTSTEIPLQVKPKPEDYPATAAWLPARSLSLSESWNPEPDHSKVGDSLTRTLTLKAEGLSSAQLPPLPATDVNGLRRYPDLPQLSNQVTDNGLIGSREEREALVPTRVGQVELPAVELVWWNTHEDRLERSYLPARTLQVAANTSLAADTPTGAGPIADSDDSTLWLWQLSTLLLACSTLIGFGLWWRARWQPAILRAAQTGPSPRTLLDDIKRACLANDPQATRQALDAWARQQPETLAEMAARFVLLSDALDGLNGALYSETGQYWQGEELWKAIRSIPAAEREQDTASESSSLPPLYPK